MTTTKYCPTCKQPLPRAAQPSAAQVLAADRARRDAAYKSDPAVIAAANDRERQLNYYSAYDGDRYEAAGRPPVSWDANGVCSFPATPWPTDAQWAAMTPEQKANPGSVLPGELPGV